MPAAPRSVLEESGEASEKACVAGEEEGARQRWRLSAVDYEGTSLGAHPNVELECKKLHRL